MPRTQISMQNQFTSKSLALVFFREDVNIIEIGGFATPYDSAIIEQI